MQLYKVLNKDLISPYQNFQYEIGKQYDLRDGFDSNPQNECSTRFYATDIDGLPYAYNTYKDIYHCEVGGNKIEIDQFKRGYQKIKIIRKIEKQELLDIIKEKKWDSKVGYKISEVIDPINPLMIKRKKQVSKNEISLLLERWASIKVSVRVSIWALIRDSIRVSVRTSVWDSIWASIWASVWDSIWASVRASVWDSIRASVWDSVRASVAAYISSIFPNIKKWKYIDYPESQNPYQSGIDLWHKGLMPYFDGKIWYLCAGKKANIIYKMK